MKSPYRSALGTAFHLNIGVRVLICSPGSDTVPGEMITGG